MEGDLFGWIGCSHTEKKVVKNSWQLFNIS